MGAASWLRPADLLAGLPDGLDGRDAGLALELSHRPGVVPRRGRDLRVELLDTIKAQALAAYEEARTKRLGADSAARRPALGVEGS